MVSRTDAAGSVKSGPAALVKRPKLNGVEVVLLGIPDVQGSLRGKRCGRKPSNRPCARALP